MEYYKIHMFFFFEISIVSALFDQIVSSQHVDVRCRNSMQTGNIITVARKFWNYDVERIRSVSPPTLPNFEIIIIITTERESFKIAREW